MDANTPTLFSPGPLHSERKSIENELKPKLRTGDIFFRRGKISFCGIPFEKLVASITQSKFSHASIALIRDDDVWMLEVNDAGTQLIRLVDWLDYCATDDFEVHRISLSTIQREWVQKSILDFVKQDPDYDFTFSSDNLFYCTESVAYIYNEAGIPLGSPKYLKDLISPKWYRVFVAGNWLVKKLTGKYVPVDKPLYFVGNSTQGLMSAKGLEKIYESNHV